MKRSVLLLLLSLCAFSLFAQKKNEPVQLVSAEAMEGIIDSVATFKGNCIFKQGGLFLYCDSARQFQRSNRIEAFGHVRMVQGDTITLTSDKLFYYGTEKRARATGNVHLRDKTMELKTDALDYDVNAGTAFYTTGAIIKDAEYTLTSKVGMYHTYTRIFNFRDQVRVRNEKKKYEVDADTLEYQTRSRLVTFRGPARISTPHGNLNADHGEYNMATGVMTVNGRSRVQRENYILEGKSINYNELSEVGVAKGNVRITMIKDSIIIDGEVAHYNGKHGHAKVFGSPLLRQFSKSDTLFLRADTLEALNPPKDSVTGFLKAYNHVRIARLDLRGRCDSLVFLKKDSMITMLGMPVLWNKETQISADTIKMKFQNGKPYALYLKQRAFIADRDSLGVFNQVSGRTMTAYMKDDAMDVMFVDGNGESIYYAVDPKKRKVIGLNYTICSNIVIDFDSNNVSRVSFLVKPESKFIPPQEITSENKYLKNFAWRKKERPGLRAE